MKAKIRFIVLILLFFSFTSIAQLDTYKYKMEIKGASEQWHSLTVPNEFFAVASSSLNDIRVYGITPRDTIEVPYIMNIASDNNISKEVIFKKINESNRGNRYFFTFAVPNTEPINEIHLAFDNDDFDWKIVLEASQNQTEWFTILEDYRILSIKNKQTDYAFTQLNFPPAKYGYYRVSFKSGKKPELGKVSIYMNEKADVHYIKYKDYGMHITEDEKNQATDIIIDLKQRYPIGLLNINVADTYDFYRPIHIQYASDSVKSEKGWRYRFQSLFKGTLNSIEDSEFKFPSTLAQKLKITIQNHDNQPLEIKGLSIKGIEHKIFARFNKKGVYYLAYGKEHDRKPKYDITESMANIPKTMTTLSVGKELKIPKKPKEVKRPIFENKLWLWIIMGITILVIGSFTLKMMSNK